MTAKTSRGFDRMAQRIKELESQLDRLYRVGHCGSVDSFLACDDEVKRGYFAMMIEESVENKKLRAERDELKRDAERYRAVKEYGWIECPNCITPWKCNGPHIIGGPELDAAIDAAMKEKP